MILNHVPCYSPHVQRLRVFVLLIAQHELPSLAPGLLSSKTGIILLYGNYDDTRNEGAAAGMVCTAATVIPNQVYVRLLRCRMNVRSLDTLANVTLERVEIDAVPE